jgi:hypothetical protein
MGAVMGAGGVLLLAYKYLQDKVVSQDAAMKTLKKFPTKKRAKMTMKESAKFLMSSPYIRDLAILVISYGMCINIVEVSWKAKLKQAFPDPNSYSAFSTSCSTTFPDEIERLDDNFTNALTVFHSFSLLKSKSGELFVCHRRGDADHDAAWPFDLLALRLEDSRPRYSHGTRFVRIGEVRFLAPSCAHTLFARSSVLFCPCDRASSMPRR